ncbi:YncE family protein, partial [Planctomycetota bacterium]
MTRASLRTLSLLLAAIVVAPVALAGAKQPKYKSPTCIAFSPQGNLAYVTNHTADSVSVIDAASGKVAAEVPVGRGPTGIAASADGKWVYVANTRDHSVSVVNCQTRKAVAAISCGFEPTGVALSRDGGRLYTANLISDDVSVIDTTARKEVKRIPAGRAPTYLALTPDGKRLLVNHLLSAEPATNPKLTTAVSVIDTAQGKVVAQKRSPGTMLLGQGITVSPDGRFAFCVHSRPNFNVTPSQLAQGWVHTNALTAIPLAADAKAKPFTV